MPIEIEQSSTTGICFGVERTIETLKKVAREQGKVQVLGAIVHNREVEQEMAGCGVTVAGSLQEMKSKIIAIGAHGVTPEVEAEMRAMGGVVIDTTCPFVRRAHVAARRMARAGFSVVVYGDANHVEVKGILGWAEGKGIATLDDNFPDSLGTLPRRIGILSQTTQIPARFSRFINRIVEASMPIDAELRIVNTICHDTKKRQLSAVELAQRADLMFVTGSRTSANTAHLVQLCAGFAETRPIETAADIAPSLIAGHHRIGVTGGASTTQHTIDEVVKRLRELAG